LVKIVSIFKTEQEALEAVKKLAAEDISDSIITFLTSRYEEQIKHEVFLRVIELRMIITGVIIGSLLGGGYFLSIAMGGINPPLLLPLTASGPYAAAFIGSGMGAAVGALVAGLWGLLLPIKEDYTDNTLLILFCHRNKKRKAIKAIASYGGNFI